MAGFVEAAVERDGSFYVLWLWQLQVQAQAQSLCICLASALSASRSYIDDCNMKHITLSNKIFARPNRPSERTVQRRLALPPLQNRTRSHRAFCAAADASQRSLRGGRLPPSRI